MKTATLTTIKMSQSLLKNLYEYEWGDACGIPIKKIYIDGMVFPPTPNQALGQWFEEQATGEPPTRGESPIPKMTQRGELTAPYKRMQIHAEHFKNIMKQYNIKIIETGFSFDHPKYSGIADIYALWNGKSCIIDLKSTGLLNDKWHEWGWGEERLESKEKLLVQAVQYKLLAREVLGEDVDFYFFVFSTANENDAKIFKVEVDDWKLDMHKQDLDNALIYLDKFLSFSDEQLAKPDMKKCMECPLKDECKFATDIPIIKSIQVQ